MARLPNGFNYSKVWCLSFHWKNNLIFNKNWVLWEKMNLDEKWNFEQKIHFSSNFKNLPKMNKKISIFSKKIKTLFCFKIASICCKLIPKLMSESSESTLCDYKAWNAQKLNVTILAHLKAQKYTFSAKISWIFYFQNSKLASLKPVKKKTKLWLVQWDPMTLNMLPLWYQVIPIVLEL